MPLSQPVDRELIHTREIRCEGYLRSDGLWDIEGVLRDTKTYELQHLLRHPVEAGAPTHDMKARLTISDDRKIVAVQIAMDAYAFPACPIALPNYQQLVGLEVGAGFTKKMYELVGHTHGCTHMVWLLQCIARTAVQTLTKRVRRGQASELNAIFGRRSDSGDPALIDSCSAYAVDGEVVRQLYPVYYKQPGGAR
ncbi:MAG: DUF2889 domain-containing protein [FCB group bacterium]|jgi:hypothetical protein|nr:DUF2889 domain-containing protein [FCB group bacterium]